MSEPDGRLAVPASRPRVVVLRGHSANPWDLRVWERLQDRFDVTCLVTGSNEFSVERVALPTQAAPALRDRLPPGRAGRAVAYALGDRYLDLRSALQGAAIVHAAEIHTWFSAQAARLRDALGFAFVLTVWETVPLLGSYRWRRERRYRKVVLGQVDRFLPATERARRALALEGVDLSRTTVCPPGIDQDRFSPAADVAPVGHSHLVLSVGRLVWEKGHQDVIRAVAALRGGVVGDPRDVRLMIVGSGPEEARLRRHAQELGLGAAATFVPFVPYDEMPALYRQASALVLASLPRRGWEEQFGMVLAEALASGTAIVATRSGAIPEVTGDAASLVDPGDWRALAAALQAGPLSRAPGARVTHDPERVRLFSIEAAAQRLGAAYDAVLTPPALAPVVAR